MGSFPMPWFSVSARRAQKLAAARRAIESPDAVPSNALEREFDSLWRDLDQLQDVSFKARDSARARWRYSGRRMPFMALAGAALLLAIGVAAVLGVSRYRDRIPSMETAYATDAGQQLVTLADGSAIRLNVDTRLAVRYFRDRREVSLETGEAFFSVARDERRPFEVAAGVVRLRVLGTQFNVRRQGDSVDVAVRDGRVAAYGDRETTAIAILGAGENAVFSAAGLDRAIGRIAPDAAGAWTEGWIKLDGAPLSELIAELVRYRPADIDISPEAAGLRVSGAFRTNDLNGVVGMLPKVLPVTVSTETNRYVIRAAVATSQVVEPPRILEAPLPR